MKKKQYFTVEFICDSGEDLQKLCQELMKKYPQYNKDKSGTMVTMWSDGKNRNDDNLTQALMDIRNLKLSPEHATMENIVSIADEALGFNN